MMQKILGLLLVGLWHFSVIAQTDLQKPKDFIVSVFHEKTPKIGVYWLSKADKKVISDITQHRYSQLRIRYWYLENETVWVLNEIGKEKPITVGIHIKNKQIEKLNVLTYRESRGDEVKHRFFTDQFNHASLNEQQQLSKHIDGITGATLSVRALKKVAKVALWLDQQVSLNTERL